MIINMTSKYTKWGLQNAKYLLILTESPILSFRYSLESSLSQQRSDVSPPYFIRLIRYKNLRSRVGESDLQISKLLIFTQFSFKLISNWSLNFPEVCYFPMPQIMDTPVSRSSPKNSRLKLRRNSAKMSMFAHNSMKLIKGIQIGQKFNQINLLHSTV